MKSRTKLIVGSLLILSLAALLWANRSVLTNAIARKEGVTVLRLKEIRALQHSSTVLGVAWAPDGKRLATYSDWGQQITIWNSDGTRLKEIRREEGAPDYGNSFVFLSGGKLLLTAARHSSPADSHIAFALWDLDTGAVVREIDGPEPDKVMQYNKPVAFAASADEQRVAFTSIQQNAPVNLYATQDWNIVRRFPIDYASNVFGAAVSLAFSLDGGLLAVGRAGNTVLLFDLRHPETAPGVLHVYASDHPVSIQSLAFSPDGRFLATGSGPRFGRQDVVEAPDQAWGHAPVKVWRVADQKLITAFPGPFTPVRQLSWSADGRFLAAAAGDGTARVFAPGAPAEQAGVATFDDPVSSAQFSPHGNELAVASGNAATIFKLEH